MAKTWKDIFFKSKKDNIHCEYCGAPYPKSKMETYNGNTCQLYSDYSDIRDSFKEPFTLGELTLKCRNSFLEKYQDIQDFDKTIKEMLVDIDFNDLGIVHIVGNDLFKIV